MMEIKTLSAALFKKFRLGFKVQFLFWCSHGFENALKGVEGLNLAFRCFVCAPLVVRGIFGIC